jgi:hypothetical protein
MVLLTVTYLIIKFLYDGITILFSIHTKKKKRLKTCLIIKFLYDGITILFSLPTKQRSVLPVWSISTKKNRRPLRLLLYAMCVDDVRFSACYLELNSICVLFLGNRSNSLEMQSDNEKKETNYINLK